MRIKSLLATTVCTSLAVTAAQGGVIVDTLPANNNANMNPDGGQTFTTGSLGAETNLVSIEVEGPQTVGTESLGPFSLELWTDTDGNHTTWDLGTLLGTSTAGTMVAGGATLTSFDFSDVTLSDNTVYAFRWVDANTNVPVRARMGLTNANGIADGTLFSNGSDPFNGAFDTAMRITTNVPEPGSLALLSIGGLLIARRRRG